MKRSAMLLLALAGAAALTGCVGFVPQPVAADVHVVHAPRPVVVHPAPVVVHPGPPPRAYRDRDGDGVPNRYDRRPRNPYRY